MVFQSGKTKPCKARRQICREAAKEISLGLQSEVKVPYRLGVLKGRRKFSILKDFPPPLQGGRDIANLLPGVKTPGYFPPPLRGFFYCRPKGRWSYYRKIRPVFALDGNISVASLLAHKKKPFLIGRAFLF